MGIPLPSRLALVTALAGGVLGGLLTGLPARADVLPDNRADVFYSKYSGGGMAISTYEASAHVNATENIGLDYSYLVDKVSGASVDVLSNASVIKDERKQNSINVTWIHDKTTYTLGYSNSKERDYISNTPHFSLSQDMFGDLTTITLGFSRSRDEVGENDGTAQNPNVVWLGHAESRTYDIGLSQILTRNLIAAVTFDIVTDDGYLANPYRSVRYYSSSALGYSLGSQVYPDTRTSTAIEGRLKYYLPYRASITGVYRYYRDTWGIIGDTIEIDYTHPVRNKWIFEGRVRYYKQGHANFYADIFPYADAQNFEGRDKDLAASENLTIGAKATYAWLPDGWKVFKRSTVTADISQVRFHYLDFRDIKDYNDTPAGGDYAAGSEPLYHFNAMIYQVYLSAFF
jgi:hypothetical protein